MCLVCLQTLLDRQFHRAGMCMFCSRLCPQGHTRTDTAVREESCLNAGQTLKTAIFCYFAFDFASLTFLTFSLLLFWQQQQRKACLSQRVPLKISQLILQRHWGLRGGNLGLEAHNH